MMSIQNVKPSSPTPSTKQPPKVNALAMGMAIKSMYEQGRKDFNSENLAGLKLSCCKLPAISLTSSDLRDADLDLTDLSGANLQGANL